MSKFAPALALSAALVSLPFAAAAQSQLDQFEALSERMTELTYQGLAEQFPQVQGLLPSAEWDRPMRRAGRCALRAYEAEVGEAGVAAMLAELASAIGSARPSDMFDGTFSAGVPEGLSAQDVQRINTECGGTELQMQRLAESGVMQALQAQ
ncbi:hypothetical protein [Hasllibacter sp. MH4015]|uniref:hypothetical protein n=1 Tax=Hasllibacter sp. MH4015 TaxID=2854029 RepID=UPI001CD501EF|nr:hypothetical protein [Hasllibacter sp. MH4015]